MYINEHLVVTGTGRVNFTITPSLAVSKYSIFGMYVFKTVFNYEISFSTSTIISSKAATNDSVSAVVSKPIWPSIFAWAIEQKHHI
jgi:hypothetical protein